MNMKANLKTSFMLLGTLALTLVLLTSCVEIPSEAPPFPEFKAKVRIIHTSNDLGEPGVLMDGSGVGAVAKGGATSYMDVDAGDHVFQVNTEDADTLFIDTDFVGTVYLTTMTAGYKKRYLKTRERWLYNAPAKEGKASVVIMNLCPDGTFKVVLTTDETTTSSLSDGLAYTKYVSKELDVSGHTYYYTVYDGDTPLQRIDITPASGRSMTHVFMNAKADLAIKEFGNE